ncbi:MAG TPA: aldo/keto reductase, partial [Gammaproteobacteria bacterium]|nr:aldo/keto reductase [Gammaproteobacteria bacterium]
MKRELDSTGIKVRAVGLGAMPLSIQGRPDEARAYEVIKAFIDCGGDFIDTANVYCLDDSDLGHNERLLHKVLARLGVLDTVLVATKGGLTRPRGRWEVDGRPEWLRSSCERS